MSSRRGFLKLRGSMMTGLAQPKRTRKSMMRPTGSMWAAGLSVRRPMSIGVLSPRATATRACAYSWMTIAMIKPGTPAMRSSGLKSNIDSPLILLYLLHLAAFCWAASIRMEMTDFASTMRPSCAMATASSKGTLTTLMNSSSSVCCLPAVRPSAA